MHARERNANTLIAHRSPSPLNIDVLNSGKAQARADRKTTVAAIALAAYMVYASIKYAVSDWRICAIPIPKGIDATIGTKGDMGGCEVLKVAIIQMSLERLRR